MRKRTTGANMGKEQYSSWLEPVILRVSVLRLIVVTDDFVWLSRAQNHLIAPPGVLYELDYHLIVAGTL